MRILIFPDIYPFNNIALLPLILILTIPLFILSIPIYAIYKELVKLSDLFNQFTKFIQDYFPNIFPINNKFGILILSPLILLCFVICSIILLPFVFALYLTEFFLRNILIDIYEICDYIKNLR